MIPFPMKFTVRFLLLLTALVLVARAEVTINFGAGQLYDQNHDPLPTGSLVLLVTDTTHNGFAQLSSGTLTAGSFLDGSDDLILALAAVDDFGTFQGVSDAFQGSLHDGWGAGDPLAVIWFSGVTISDAVLHGGEYYGTFTSATGEDGSDPWTTPADGTTAWTLTFLTASADGTVHADALGDASLTVAAVPEPATYAALAGLLALGLAGWRRRAHP